MRIKNNIIENVFGTKSFGRIFLGSEKG